MLETVADNSAPKPRCVSYAAAYNSSLAAADTGSLSSAMGNSNSHANGPQNAHGPTPLPTPNSTLPASTHTPSAAAARRPSPQTRTASSTGRPYKQKKRSIELPDLQAISLTPQRVPSALPSAPINIPNAAGRPPRDPPPRLVSDADMLQAGPSSVVVAAPPPLLPARVGSNASFTRKTKEKNLKKKSYKQHIVRSYLPSGVPTAHDGIVNVTTTATQNNENGADADQNVPVLVVWRAGANNKVLVTGTYEPTPWENKTELEYEHISKTYKTVINVAPAAYHLKFIVDDVWRCSDDLPTATDGAGHLVNYIDVRRRGEEIKEWGKDWWGVGTEDEEDQG